jgi:hypothetical protein
MKKFSIEIKWSIIFVIVYLLWMVFEKLVGWHGEHIDQHGLYTNIFGLIALGIYILAIRDKRNNYFNGIITWRQGFASGILLTVIITAISPISQYIATTYISPEYFDNMIELKVNNNAMRQEQAEAYFNLKSYIIQAFFSALIMGVGTAALAALINRTNPKLRFEE